MVDEVDRGMLKSLALGIVIAVDPGDAFVIEDGFDELADDWHKAGSQNEGRFIGGPEIATFAGVLVPFLLGFLGDVTKDIAKEQARKAIATTMDKYLHGKASASETERLAVEFDDAVKRSRFSDKQKEVLGEGMRALFAKVGPAP